MAAAVVLAAVAAACLLPGGGAADTHEAASSTRAFPVLHAFGLDGDVSARGTLTASRGAAAGRWELELTPFEVTADAAAQLRAGLARDEWYIVRLPVNASAPGGASVQAGVKLVRGHQQHLACPVSHSVRQSVPPYPTTRRAHWRTPTSGMRWRCT